MRLNDSRDRLAAMNIATLLYPWQSCCWRSVPCSAPARRRSSGTSITPSLSSASDVQQNPETYRGAEVVWGGRIVAVENRPDTTEVEVVAYPLDRDQQPMPEAPAQGRFLLVLPGFVEPFDYPAGRHLTVHGVLAGTRVGHVQEHAYLFPLVRARAVNVWPWGFIFDKKPRVSIGVGIGARIH